MIWFERKDFLNRNWTAKTSKEEAPQKELTPAQQAAVWARELFLLGMWFRDHDEKQDMRP